MTEQKIQSQHIEGKIGYGFVALFYQPETQTGFHEGYEVVQGYSAIGKRRVFKAYWYNSKEKALKAYDKAVKNITTKLA
jgi:hypothetical protein